MYVVRSTEQMLKINITDVNLTPKNVYTTRHIIFKLNIRYIFILTS